MGAILLSVNLKGHISGPQKHTDKQIVSVDVTPIGVKSPEILHKKIKHNDRLATGCVRKMKISEEIVAEWERAECPHWEKVGHWKTLSKAQKVQSHLKRYDEGFGISYDFVD